MTDTTETQSRAHRLPRWRRALVAILVVLSVVLLPIAGLTVWVRNLVLDTDKYVETVAPLASNKDVTDTIANRITTRLFTEVNVEQQAKDALPERAQFLASPIATGVETFTARPQPERWRATNSRRCGATPTSVRTRPSTRY